MTKDLARRDLLRGYLTPVTAPIRPPGAIAEKNFLSLCTPCQDCASACPHDLIDHDKAGRPVMNFAQTTCVFCADCTRACKSGALDEQQARPWQVMAQINQDCLSRNGITCRTCGDHCDEQAISFELMTKGRSQPIINDDQCTGCGACMRICPNKSITIITLSDEERGTRP